MKYVNYLFPIVFILFTACSETGSSDNNDGQQQETEAQNSTDDPTANEDIDPDTTTLTSTDEVPEPETKKLAEKKKTVTDGTRTGYPQEKPTPAKEEVKKEEPPKPDPVKEEPVVAKEERAEYSYKLSSGQLRVTGTSTLHDWEMIAKSYSANAQIVFGADNILTEVKSLNLTMPAKNLKADEKKMNELAWEALKADKHPNITFKLTNAIVTPQGSNTYQIRGIGNLTIAGTTKQVTLNTTAKVNGSAITFTGNESTKMTTFNVEPPSLMMGTIKTHDNIVLHFNATINR